MITTKKQTKKKKRFTFYTLTWEFWLLAGVAGSSGVAAATRVIWHNRALPFPILCWIKKKVQTQLLNVDLSEKHARTASMKHPVKK